MKKIEILISSVSMIALVGCSGAMVKTTDACCQTTQEVEVTTTSTEVREAKSCCEFPKVSSQKPDLLKITAVGYGAESAFGNLTEGQKRLMAIRSSKLDAYRALAEQISGIKIDSNTSVASLSARNDSFRARVNAIVKGARVISVTPMADNNYETVLEVLVDKEFFEQAFVYSGNQDSNSTESLYNIRQLY